MANKEKQEIMIIIVAVFLAFILWIYVMGEENPPKTIVVKDVPVKIVNQDNISQMGLALMPEQNITVDLTVRGRSLSVVNVTSNDFVVEADLAGYPIRKGPCQIPYKITSKPASIDIVNNNQYNLINVEFDTYIEKTVPVIVNVSGSVKDGYGYLKPDRRPTEVIVSGPERYVNSVVSSVGQIGIDEETAKDINAVIPVKPVGRDGSTVPFVNLEPRNVNILITVKPAKTVPVVVKTTGQPAEGKVVMGIKPKIANLMIIGDSKVLDKIKEIATIPVDLSKVTVTSTKEVFLNIPSGVTVVTDSNDIKSINVDFTVENKIQKTFTVPLSTINSQDAYNYDIKTASINVTLSGAESDMNSIDVKDISAAVDLKDLGEGSHELPVKITYPDKADVADYSPQKVAVTITKK